ncbi:hypothetical protein CSHISOI_11811, partial [Colletotrichum shisoi]
ATTTHRQQQNPAGGHTRGHSPVDRYQQQDQRGPPGGGYNGRDGHRDVPAPIDRPTPKQLADLTKLYSGNDMKYGGEKYDVLDIKLMIFRENCNNAGISNDANHLAAAFPFMLKGKAYDFYVQRLCLRVPRDFFILVDAVRRQFETEETIKAYLAEWQQISFRQIESSEPSKTKTEILELMISRLNVIQRALPASYQTDDFFRLQLLNACRGVPEARLCLYNPANTLEGVCGQLRSAIATAEYEAKAAGQYFTHDPPANDHHNHHDSHHPHDPHGQHFTDRTYHGNGKDNRYGNKGQQRGNRPTPTDRKCYVCKQQGCYSTKHTPEERRAAYDKYKASKYTQGRGGQATYNAFLTSYEGTDPTFTDDDSEEDLTQYLQGITIEEGPQTKTDEDGTFHMTTAYFGETDFDGKAMMGQLADQSFTHYLTKADQGIRQHIQKLQRKEDPADHTQKLQRKEDLVDEVVDDLGDSTEAKPEPL